MSEPWVEEMADMVWLVTSARLQLARPFSIKRLTAATLESAGHQRDISHGRHQLHGCGVHIG